MGTPDGELKLTDTDEGFWELLQSLRSYALRFPWLTAVLFDGQVVEPSRLWAISRWASALMAYSAC